MACRPTSRTPPSSNATSPYPDPADRRIWCRAEQSDGPPVCCNTSVWSGVQRPAWIRGESCGAPGSVSPLRGPHSSSGSARAH